MTNKYNTSSESDLKAQQTANLSRLSASPLYETQKYSLGHFAKIRARTDLAAAEIEAFFSRLPMRKAEAGREHAQAANELCGAVGDDASTLRVCESPRPSNHHDEKHDADDGAARTSAATLTRPI